MLARTTRALTALVAVALLSTAIAADAASVSSAPKAKAPHTTSTRKVALGVSMWPSYNDQTTYTNFVSATGRAPALWSVWVNWADSANTSPAFPTNLVEQLHSAGSTPLIIWLPVGYDPAPGGDKKPLESSCGTSYDNIINGSWDAYIKEWAHAAKLAGGRVLIRFAHEMDGGWFPYGVTRCTNTDTKFKKMWKHVVKIFRTEGATNVKFVWSPLNAGTKAKPLYPGNAWVDYVGFSAFNWGSYKNARWIDLATRAENMTKGLKSYAGSKPWIIAETGSVQEDGHTRASWLTSGYKAVYSKMPNVAAIVYFDVDMRGVQPHQPDWRLTGNAVTAYKALLALKKFQGKVS